MFLNLLEANFASPVIDAKLVRSVNMLTCLYAAQYTACTIGNVTIPVSGII